MRRRLKVQIPGRSNLTLQAVRPASTSMQVPVSVFSWRYVVELGTANSLHGSM